MKHILLLGAGFSCNWGGWSAADVNDFLPTVANVRADRHVLQVLSRTASAGGFEAALAELREDYAKAPTQENLAHLQTLQSAVTVMFRTMERGFASRPDWNFKHTVEYKIAHFLSGFDAIFTLNQDLLFERHYYDADLALNQPKKWFGWRRPGIRALNDLNQGRPYDVSLVTWTPIAPPFRLEAAHQPYIKMHGSWNWWSADGQQMLIMGGNKPAAIQQHPLLQWYHGLFETYLSEPDSGLMVIGYGFGDPHINQMIERAADKNPTMLLFAVDPRGRSILPARISQIDAAGTSRPLLKDTFAGNEAERLKLMSFFS